MPLISAWTFCAISQCLLIFRLARLDLIRVYPAFTALLLCDLVRSAILSALDWHSFSYGLVWIVGEGIYASLITLTVTELYWRAVARIPNPGRFGNTALLVMGLISVCVAFVATLMGDIPTNAVDAALDAKRIIVCGLLVTVLLSMALFRLGRVPVPRNVVLHRRILALYLAAVAISSVAQIAWTWAVGSVLALLAEGSCYLLWSIRLSASGERAPSAKPFTETEKDRLIDITIGQMRSFQELRRRTRTFI